MNFDTDVMQVFSESFLNLISGHSEIPAIIERIYSSFVVLHRGLSVFHTSH